MEKQNQFEYTGTRAAKDYYDAFSASYEKERHQNYHKMIDDLEIAAIKHFLRPEMKVLEAGCGTGIIMHRLKEIVHDIVGVDISEKMLEVARKRNLNVVASDLISLPFLENSFDFVYSFKVLPHIKNIEKAVLELARVTKIGGHLALEFYNKRSLRGFIKKIKSPTSITENVQDTDMFTRLETLGQFLSYLPSVLKVKKICGVRTITPSAFFIKIPVINSVFINLEKILSRTFLGRWFGGFIVVICKKTMN